MADDITVEVLGKGSVRIPHGSAVKDALSSALGSAAERVAAALVDGKVSDVFRPLTAACTVEPLDLGDPRALEVIRHSAAHLLAQAVKRLYPQAQVTIGPVIADGFYYDFKYDPGFAPEDLERIEAEMAKIVAANYPLSRDVLSREEATRFFRDLGEDFKAEIIASLPDAEVSIYRQGEFVDLCRGPHVPRTGCLAAVKLTHVAGAYWRGDERNPMLQRIYGTAFADKTSLDEHLARLEEAKRRDHRRLGKQLGLFSFHPEAPATPFFLPDGARLYNRLVRYIRDLYVEYGYDEVITPQILDRDLWLRSGHYDHYKDNMYFTEVEGRDFAVKPMNCPTHCLIYGEGLHSYRDLPLRFADFGRLHRYERSGVVHGLTRVRSFCQDDAHIYCTSDQMHDEVRSVIRMIGDTHRAFGFGETKVYLSTRPEKSIGTDEMWALAEKSLRDALTAESVPFEVNPGDGAFYGPKIDFCVLDAMRREWQLSTAQLDFSMPDRFELSYIDSKGESRRPVMIHRAILGSLERFIGILIEHTGGAFPLWLAPQQIRLVTVTDRPNEYASAAVAKLRRAGLRAVADLRNEKLGFKVREAQQAKIPVVGVIGDREMEQGTIAPRLRDGSKIDAMTIDAFVAWLAEHDRPGDGGVP